ncbi:uncharacterized protein LOC112552830 [Pogonomyrmex barbatus]|uniref:Uncharacterized protein LOC112552830 n=1 Tax=Pogonomyrmex barbatus TaxID=144034 RepID=A0A8N1S9U9_9HYME|nr:uncharacterized protein LOC112552830 [Pogonomyrmex barbatus]
MAGARSWCRSCETSMVLDVVVFSKVQKARKRTSRKEPTPSRCFTGFDLQFYPRSVFKTFAKPKIFSSNRIEKRIERNTSRHRVKIENTWISLRIYFHLRGIRVYGEPNRNLRRTKLRTSEHREGHVGRFFLREHGRRSGAR